MAVDMSVGLRLLEAHLGRFNEGVRTGDFDPMVEALDPDARLELVGVPAGPFDGREAIRTAYREMPPDDQIDLLGADEPDPGTIIGRWRWHSTGATGRMRLDHAAGVITAVTVSFDPIATQAAAAPAAAGLPAPSATSAPASPPAPTAAASPGAGGAPSAAAAPITADARGPLDAEALRADFPILAERPHGKPLVYLDSAATSQKPLAVIEALDTYYREYNANVHRGIYSIGERATRAYEAARAAVATFINAPDPHEIVFARNATEAINLVAYSWGRRTIGRGDAIVLTEMEHHANLVPWQILAQEVDGDLEFIPITDEGILRLDVFEVLLRLRPKLVALAHVSNTLGTINPVREIVEMAHAAGALVLIDGAQAVPHLPVDVQALGADFYAFSGHKMLAPMGSGALWARREILESMPPFLAGGEMIREVKLRRSEFNEIPWKFEAGTPDVAAAVGFGVAADYLRALGMDRVREHERELVGYALDTLRREVPGIELYGPGPEVRGGVVPFNLPGIHPHDVAQILDRSGVCVRAGHHCTMPLHERLDLAATARASFSVFTTHADIDALATGLREVRRVFGV